MIYLNWPPEYRCSNALNSISLNMHCSRGVEQMCMISMLDVIDDVESVDSFGSIDAAAAAAAAVVAVAVVDGDSDIP